MAGFNLFLFSKFLNFTDGRKRGRSILIVGYALVNVGRGDGGRRRGGQDRDQQRGKIGQGVDDVVRVGTFSLCWPWLPSPFHILEREVLKVMSGNATDTSSTIFVISFNAHTSLQHREVKYEAGIVCMDEYLKNYMNTWTQFQVTLWGPYCLDTQKRPLERMGVL